MKSLDEVSLSGQPVYVVYPAVHAIFEVTKYIPGERSFVIRKAEQVFGPEAEPGQVGNGYVDKQAAYQALEISIREDLRKHSQAAAHHSSERLRLAKLRLELGPVLHGNW